MSADVMPVKAMYKGVQNWSEEKEMKLRKFHSLAQMEDPSEKLKMADAIERALDIALEIKLDNLKTT